MYSSEKIKELQNEIKVKDMLFLDKKNQLFEMEKKMHESESEKEKYRILSLQRNLKIEEMRLKYEPGK